MQKLSDGMLLYHGSYMVVDTPDLAKCAARKDFGQGFIEFLFIRATKPSDIDSMEQPKK